MPLSAGTRLGPYEIVAPLGAGGMGEVYRARDTRPDRAQGEFDHLWPEMLPDGRAVLFTITALTGGLDAAQVAVLDLETWTRRILVRGGSDRRPLRAERPSRLRGGRHGIAVTARSRSMPTSLCVATAWSTCTPTGSGSRSRPSRKRKAARSGTTSRSSSTSSTSCAVSRRRRRSRTREAALKTRRATLVR